jgi:hypothetical protein
MEYPTIHLNGTSRKELLSQFCEAHSAIGRAIDAMHKATPHGRDYYPQGDGAIDRARTDHASRIAKLAEVQAEILAIGESVA